MYKVRIDDNEIFALAQEYYIRQGISPDEKNSYFYIRSVMRPRGYLPYDVVEHFGSDEKIEQHFREARYRTVDDAKEGVRSFLKKELGYD